MRRSNPSKGKHMKAQPTTKQLIEMLYERLPELFDRAKAQPAPVQPVAWVPVTETLLHEQHAWLYETMWIAMKDGRVLKGRYEWRQGRKPDRFYSDGAGDEWAYAASHVMPLQAPAHPSTTPPAAQPAPAPMAHIVGEIDHNGKVWTPAQPAVPDAFGTREGEHPQYIQGWNDCRAETLKMRKP
jgi:hypothetical protein